MSSKSIPNVHFTKANSNTPSSNVQINASDISEISNQLENGEQFTDFKSKSSSDPNMNHRDDYDPKYGGKSFFELPSLKRIKHRLSFSGTVIVLLVCFVLYQQFGGQSRKPPQSSEMKNEEVVRMNPGYVKHLGDPNNPRTYKPAPVHLRPGYVPPPKQNQPDGQQPYPNRLPNQHENINKPPKPFDAQEYEESLKKAYERSKENLERFMGQDSDQNQIPNDNIIDSDRELDGVEGKGHDDDFALNNNPQKDGVIIQTKKPDPAHANYEKIRDFNKVNPYDDRLPVKPPERQMSQNKDSVVLNRVQKINRPAVDNMHDFHDVKQKYAVIKEPVMEAMDLSQYRAAGRAAQEKQQQIQQLKKQQQQQRYQHAAGVNAANPFEKFMADQRQAENIRPHPSQWPVSILKEPDIGCLAGVDVLILVHTHPSAFGTRRAIRNSWGIQTLDKYPRLGNSPKWKTIFILGKDNTIQWENEVSTEQKEFNDILQGDFTDNQYEGTRKFLLGLTWLTRNIELGCEPRFILKTEENIYHNMNSIIGWIEAKFTGDYSGIYMGKKLIKDLPVRDLRDPYYVSWQEYPQTYFPDMIQGPEILFDYDTYKLLGRQTPYVTRLAVEEGYISLLADRAKVLPTHNEHFILLEQTSNICHMLRMFFVSDVKPSEHKKLFRGTKEALTNGKCPNAHVIQAGNKRINIEM